VHVSNGGSDLEAASSAEQEYLNEVAEMLAYRERHLVQRALESLEGPGLEASTPKLTPEEARKLVSDKAYELIVQYETGGREYYEKVYKSAPVWPGYSSGVTIGFGYDLGYIGEDEFVEVWGKLLPADAVERLKEGVGITGGGAQAIARRLKDIRVSWEVSETVFARNTVPKFVGMTMRALENFDAEMLHPHSTGALVSLVFNRGADFKSSSDKRLEMRQIREHMAEPVFKEIPGELRAMKRHWTSKGLKERRDAEAKLFERGLELQRERMKSQQPAPVARPDPVPRPDVKPAPPADILAGQPMPQLPTQAPPIDVSAPPAVVAAAGSGASAATASASDTLGIPAPPEMGTLEGIYGGAREEAVSLEDDWLAYDQLPVEQLETPSSLESTRGSYSISKVRWAGEDNEIPDYKHVAGIVEVEGPFELTADDLRTIIEANRYKPVTEGHGKILFGLRGCQLSGQTDKQVGVDALKLEIARPDHKNFRCTIGVLDVSSRKLSGFIASTVPNCNYVYKCWENSRDGEDLVGNMLPTGCYGYIVGPHNNTPSAFVLRKTLNQKRNVAVWRSTDDVTYTVQDEIQVCQPGDNIHPAYSASTAKFSSAGCQTIRGNGTGSGNHTGEWAQFRIAAGLPADGNGKYGTPYSYVLTTGVEAKAVAAMRKSGELADKAKVQSRLVRLRQGSQGEEVKTLQAALGLPPTGVLEADDIEKLVEWQRERLGWNDGIYSLDCDPHLGVNILGGLPPPQQPAQPPADVAASGQPAPIPRPDPVARPPASLGGDGSTAAGWALESTGSAAGRRAGAPRVAVVQPRRSGALESASARQQVQSLLNVDDAELVRRLGQITEQVRNDPKRAGNLELPAQAPPPALEGVFSDVLSEIGGRVYARLEPEVYKIVCGSNSADARDRSELQKAFAKVSSGGGNKNEVVTAVAGVMIGSGLAFYGVALVVATIFVRRFAQATLEETCKVWGARRRMPGSSRFGGDSETA
jgi:hypothetical protein